MSVVVQEPGPSAARAETATPAPNRTAIAKSRRFLPTFILDRSDSEFYGGEPARPGGVLLNEGGAGRHSEGGRRGTLQRRVTDVRSAGRAAARRSVLRLRVREPAATVADRASPPRPAGGASSAPLAHPPSPRALTSRTGSPGPRL